jgi:hypothetical protein
VNDVCDCCEQNDSPTSLYWDVAADVTVQLCADCYEALHKDGAIEP